MAELIAMLGKQLIDYYRCYQTAARVHIFARVKNYQENRTQHNKSYFHVTYSLITNDL